MTRAAPALLLLAAASAVPARPPADPKGPPVDASFLRRFAETRGFLLGRPVKPKVTPDGKHVLFLRADPVTKRQSLFEFDLATGKTREVLTPDALLKGGDEALTPEEKARRERQRVSAGGFADYFPSPDGRFVLVKLGNTLYVFDRTTGAVRALKPGGDGAVVDPKWSPDGKYVAYVRGFDVAAYDLAADREFAVTTGGTVTKTHGLAEFVAQEEMGRHGGFWWSPDAKHIAYAEADHAGVEQWWVADPLKPDVPPAPQFYPRPGKKNVAVRVGVTPLRGGATTWVEWDRAKYEYLARVTWGRDRLLIIIQSRDQRTLQYLTADPKSGESSLVVSASMGEAPPPGWYDLPPDWHSSKTVRSDLFLVPWDGHRSFMFWFTGNPLGKGGTLTTVGSADELIGVDEKRARFLVGAIPEDDATQRHVYRMTYRENEANEPDSFRAGGVALTREPGLHSAVFSPDFDTMVLTSTTLKAMPTAVVRGADPGGAKVGELPSVAAEPPFAPNVTVAKVGDFWTAVVRPRDFDPAKKYPVVVDVYGGPRHLHVVRAMRNWLVPQWLSDQGFVVVAVDNRGTPGRGREWERAVYQKFGTVPLDDQVKGLHALCDAHPELDRERVGIVGWSFGGYMAANGVLRRPEVFKAAVAGAPVTDWEDYDTHYTERYMGLLPASAAAYREASLLPLAPSLSRPLLLVHGTADDNVYYRHTLRLSDALFRAGRPFEALALPGVTHMASADPVVMERLWARTAGFFRTHLGGPR